MTKQHRELDEALKLLTDGKLLNRISRHNADEFVAAVAAVCEAARAYRDLANGERVEWCGYHQAVMRRPSEKDWCSVGWFRVQNGFDAECSSVVSKLLVDPLTEEE